jgi:hypothetical protein
LKAKKPNFLSECEAEMPLFATVRQVLAGVSQRLKRPPTRESFYHDFLIDFDVSKRLPADALEVLVSVVQELRASGVETIVAEGTLLGLVRDGALIAHDTDLDLYVIGPSSAVMAVECLEAAGWTVGQHARIGSVSSHITLFNSKHVLLDLTFFEQIGSQLMSFKEHDGYLAIDWDIMLPPAVMPNLNDLLVPNRPEAYLQEYYGSDWRVPKSKKTFWRDEFCGIFVRGVDDVVVARQSAIAQVGEDGQQRC